MLSYQIVGIEDELLANVRTYLGPPPETDYERDNVLYSAQRDVERALHALGHYQPVIELALDNQAQPWTLQITVDAGPRVRIGELDIVIRGEANEDEAFRQLLDDNPLQVGTGLNHETYEQFKADLLNLGNTRGYFSARLERHQVLVDVEQGLARVSVHYYSGERYRFGQVNFDEFPLSMNRLTQLMNFQQGDPFDIEKLRDLQSNLQRTGYFGTALVKPLPPDPETKEVPLQVQLQAGDRNHYRAGLGYSTDTRERISLTWRTPLLNSLGHWQETRVEYSPVRPRANFTYGIPLSHPLDDQLRLGARLEDNEFGSLDSRQHEISGRRDWKLGSWIASARLRYLNEDWELGSRKLNNEYVLPGFSMSHSSSRGDPLDPENGFSQLYGIEVGADQAGSDMDLVRLHTHLRGVLTIAPRHRLVGRAELGAVYFSDKSRPDLAPSLSFFAGGTYSIRGYAFQSLGPTETVTGPDDEKREVVFGGDRLAIVSGEYQYYVTPEWRTAVFVDAGNAFNAGDFDPVAGAGFGVHWVSPVGAIRIDLANTVSEESSTWRVHIALGAEF